MSTLLAESIEAGGLGFSSSQSRTHSDGDGNPISSRHADRREMLAFCEVVRDHPGTTLEYITNGCLDSFTDDEIDLMVAMTTTARRPLNWNLLTVDSRTPDKTARQLEASAAAAAAGGRIVALTMPTLVPMNMSFRTHCALFLIPGWGDVMGLPAEQRIEKLRDPASGPSSTSWPTPRAPACSGGSPTGPTTSSATPSPRRTPGYSWRDVGSIAEEQGKAPFDALLDLVIADDLRTVLWPKASDGDDASWQARVEVWNDPGAMVGGSDAGAHLDRMCGSNYPTSFLGRLPAQAQAGPDGAGRPADDRGAGRAVRPARPGPGGRGAACRPVRLRPRDGGVRAGHPGQRPARREPPADRRLPSAWSGCWSTGSRPWPTASRPATCPGTLLGRAATP